LIDNVLFSSVRSCVSQDILGSQFTDGDFSNLNVKENVPKHRNTAEPERQRTDQTPLPTKDDIYFCPVEGCICSFQRHCNLENHVLYGKCKFVEEKLTLLDKAKLKYREKLEEGTSQLPSVSTTPSQTTSTEVLSQGWALRTTKKRGRFNDNQRRYLDERFQLGEQSGHKADPEQVSIDMRRAKNHDGTRRFTIDEFLSAQQIKSYFSRTNAKLKNVQSDADLQAVLDHEQFISTRQAILDECHVTHPIIYDTYNICDLYKTDKLRKFNVAMLRLICEYFGIPVDDLAGARFKAPYLKLLKQLVDSCSCAVN